MERLENELEQLMAHLQTSPTPSPAGPAHSADEDNYADDDDAIDQPDQPDHHAIGGGVGAEQDLDALLARLGEEEQQIRDDIKRMRDAYARSLRRGYVATKGGGGTSASTAKPATVTSPQLSPTGGEESSDEAHEALKEAERKVTVLRRRAEEVRHSIRSQQGSRIGGRGGGFGVHGPSVRRKRDGTTVIGERRGDQAQAQISDSDGGDGGELRELERELERMEEKERARRRREAEGRARVTLEMARLLLRDEAAKRDEEDRQREEAERREAERGMAEMRDRIERMRIMAQAVKPRHTPPLPMQTPTPTMTSQPTTQHTATMMSSPLTPPSNLPPLSPVPAAALMMAARGPHLQPLTPGASPTPTQQPRQFYYTTTPPISSRPSVPPLPTPSAGPDLAPRPSFSPRATVGAGGGGRGSSTTEDDSELNSMMADMLTHLKATSAQTDVKDISPPVARAGSGSGGPPPVPPKKLTSASSAPASVDPRACGRCGKAVDEFGGGVVQAMDRRWHPACFVCHTCRYTHAHTHTFTAVVPSLLTLACAVRAGQWRTDGPAWRRCVLPTNWPTPLHRLLPTAVRPVVVRCPLLTMTLFCCNRCFASLRSFIAARRQKDGIARRWRCSGWCCRSIPDIGRRRPPPRLRRCRRPAGGPPGSRRR